LLERLRNLPGSRANLEFIPMMPSLEAMLAKADAALIVNFSPSPEPASREFSIDLVEEWSDMTGLPYVHGFWVAREEDLDSGRVEALVEAKRRGIEAMEETILSVALDAHASEEAVREYFGSFNYDFGQDQTDSLAEFFSYAYYHGVLGDVPELNFFEAPPTN